MRRALSEIYHKAPWPHALNKFVRPRWPYDMRHSARAEKYIRDAGPYAKTEVFLFWMFAHKTVQLKTKYIR